MIEIPKKDDDETGSFISVGLFIGFALGFIFDSLPAGIFGGLGLGFPLFAIVKNF